MEINANVNANIWWQTVKQMLGYCSEGCIPSLESDGPITSSRDKEELTNHYFASHSNIDTSKATLPHPSDTAYDKLETIFITEGDVSGVLNSLYSNKATGVDGVSAKLLRLVASKVSKFNFLRAKYLITLVF